jgi:hypothetical protein
MKRLIALIRREPARAFALVKMLLVVGLAFGLHLTDAQREALLGLAALILGSGEATRAMVSPNVHTEERRSTTDGP